MDMSSGSFGTGGTDEFVPERSLPPVRGRKGLLAGIAGTVGSRGVEGSGGLVTVILCELLGGGGGSILSPGDFRSGRGDVRGARGDGGASAERRPELGPGVPLAARNAVGETGAADEDTGDAGPVATREAVVNGPASSSSVSGTTVVVDP